MNKTDLVCAVAEKANLTKKDAEMAINVVMQSVIDALAAGDKVQLVGFGTFEVRERAARTGRNPQTGAPLEIPAGKIPAFKAGKAFKDAVDNK
ncbi:MAG: HU family DNA-binding protein [Peptococcaceae bacterium]|nr:HU family DNA-binding protein [Peptococcaceae bacterium]